MKEKELFPHNQQAYEAVMQHFGSGNKRAAVVHATGTGKSYIIGAVTSHYAKCLVIAPNNFVLDETRKVCHEGVEFRTYASVMYDEAPSTYDLIVLDEFHRSGAEKWGAGVQRLLDANADAFVLGTSATHIRYLDNQRNMADEVFDGNVVSHLPLKEAIDRNILPNPTYVSSIYTMDDTVRNYEKRIRSCRKKGVDKEDACRRLHGIASNWGNAGGVPAIIRKYFSHDMQRIIVFCSKVKRAAAARELLSKWFGMAGFNRVRYYNIDYKEKRLEREMEDFQAPMGGYDLKVAISVNMLNEGVHIPRVDGVIMLRSTISRIIIEQQVGRCLTSDNNGRIPVVLDLVNNMDLISYDENPFFGVDKNGDGSRADKEHSSNGFPFKVIDECRDMRVLLEQLDREISNSSHTLDECLESARRYNKKKDWRKADSKLHDYALRHGWLDICCEHMEPSRKYWTKEECHAEALKYNSRTEFATNSRLAYSSARNHGWLPDICSHMVELNHSWTKEEVRELMIGYTTLAEFSRDHPRAAKAAQNNGWSEELFGNLEKKRKKYTDEELIFIASECSSWSELTKKNESAARAIKEHGDEFRANVCAHMQPLKVNHKWTDEELAHEASKFSYLSDFMKNSQGACSAARRRGREFFERITSHMVVGINQHKNK